MKFCFVDDLWKLLKLLLLHLVVEFYTFCELFQSVITSGKFLFHLYFEVIYMLSFMDLPLFLGEILNLIFDSLVFYLAISILPLCSIGF